MMKKLKRLPVHAEDVKLLRLAKKVRRSARDLPAPRAHRKNGQQKSPPRRKLDRTSRLIITVMAKRRLRKATRVQSLPPDGAAEGGDGLARVNHPRRRLLLRSRSLVRMEQMRSMK